MKPSIPAAWSVSNMPKPQAQAAAQSSPGGSSGQREPLSRSVPSFSHLGARARATPISESSCGTFSRRAQRPTSSRAKYSSSGRPIVQVYVPLFLFPIKKMALLFGRLIIQADAPSHLRTGWYRRRAAGGNGPDRRTHSLWTRHQPGSCLCVPPASRPPGERTLRQPRAVLCQ